LEKLALSAFSLYKRTLRKCQQDGIRALFHSAKIYASEKLQTSFLPSFPMLSNYNHFPIKRATIELTDACNLRCVFCNNKSRPRGYLSLDLFRKCIDELGELGVELVSLNGGGESLLHPRFKECLAYAVENRNKGGIKKIDLVDNGMLFNEDVANMFVDLGVDEITFSLDGLGAVNDNIRIGSKYEIIENNILRLIQKRGPQKKPAININIVDYGKTKEQLNEFMQVWLGRVDTITLSKHITSKLTLTNPKYFEGKRLHKAPYCRSFFNYIGIEWDGNISPCCAMFSSQLESSNLQPGNVKSGNLKETWNNNQFKTLRKMSLKKSFPKETPCYECELWQNEFTRSVEPAMNGTAKAIYQGNGIVYRKC
jgi:radical SAM protein with 4Fe4S-binding SPASM domain